MASDGRYLKLLRDAFNGAGSGRGLHFSFDVDVTQTQQRAAKLPADAAAAAKPLHATAEPRFSWNQKLLQPLVGAPQLGTPSWIFCVCLDGVHQSISSSCGSNTEYCPG